MKKEEFVLKANTKHNYKYDYSKVEYVDYKTKVCITCPKHGEFWQKPSDHLQGKGCNQCNGGVRSNTKDFIEKAKKIHGDKYDYSKIEYTNSKSKMIIICPTHGEFWQDANHHLQGCGCPKCGGRMRLTTEAFIEKAKKIHGDKYDYSKVEYTNNRTKVCIICPEHGEFWQTPLVHLAGRGCYECGRIKTIQSITSNNENFIAKAKKIHGDKYDYSKVEYEHNARKVSIICPIHGVFRQSPNNHLQGNGCPKCTISNIEESLMRELDILNVEYVYQKRFSWLGKQSLDFYLPKYNVAIECQGRQHYQPISFSKTVIANIALQENIKRDIKKFNKCVEHNVMLYYLFNEGENMPQTLIYNSDNFCHMEKLINIIESLKKNNE